MNDLAPTSETARAMQATAARGAGWGIALGMGARAISLVGAIVITHILDPAAMGEVAIAVIVATTANAFTTIGYGQFILAKPEEGDTAAWHVAVLHVALGVLALGVMLLCHQPLAVWMNAPTLARFLPWLALAVLLDRLSFVPERILTRNLRFKHVATTRSAGELGYTVVALGLAALGFGALAIAYANVVRSGLKLVVFATGAPRRDWLVPQRLSLAKFKQILGFGAPLALTGWVSFAASRWDNLIFAMLYGPALMAEYNVAYNLADVPADQIGEQAAEVLLPSLARIKSEERHQVVLSSTGLLAFIVFPISIGLGMVATTAAHTFIGVKWDHVGPMMGILCVLSIARPLSYQIGAYLVAEGRPRTLLALELVKLGAVVALLPTLGRLSPYWACIAVGLAFIGHTLAAAYTTSRSAQFPMRLWFARVARPLLACVPLVLGVLVARRALAGFQVPALGLAGEVLGGAIGYVLGALLVARSQARELIDVVRAARERHDR